MNANLTPNNGQASVPYNRIGKQLLVTNLMTTSLKQTSNTTINGV